MRISFVSFFALVGLTVACSVVACSSDDSDGSGGSSGTSGTQVDAGTTTDSGTSSETDSGSNENPDGACNTLEATGDQVGEVAGGEPKPTPQGGTIEDGTYVLTKHEVYPPSSPDENTRRRVWKFEGGKFEALTADANAEEQRFAGTYTTDGSNLTLTLECPAGAPQVVLPYTANGGTLVMFDPEHDTDVFTYTKQ